MLIVSIFTVTVYSFRHKTLFILVILKCAVFFFSFQDDKSDESDDDDDDDGDEDDDDDSEDEAMEEEEEDEKMDEEPVDQNFRMELMKVLQQKNVLVGVQAFQLVRSDFK